SSDVSHVLAGMQWIVSFKDTYGIRVANLSLGTDSTQSYHLSPLNAAVERAWDSGIVITVSSSNNGPGAGTISQPADDPLLNTAGVGPVGDPNVDGQGSLDAYAAAHAGTFDSANVGVVRSLGTGSLDLDRGSLHVQIQTGSVLNVLLGLLLPVYQLLYGNN